MNIRILERCLLAIVIINVPLHLAKHLFLNKDAASVGAVGGFALSPAIIALVLLYGLWLLRVRAIDADYRRSTAGIPALMVLLVYVASLFVARDAALGCFQVWAVLQSFLLYFYISRTVRSRADIVLLIRLIFVGCMLESVLMLTQIAGFTKPPTLGPAGEEEYLASGRISGTTGTPNGAAAYLAMVMVVAAAVSQAKVRSGDKTLAVVVLALASIPLVATLSRGGWISFVVGFLILSALSRKHQVRTAIWVAGALLVLIGPFAGEIRARFVDDDNGSAQTRIALNKMALLMIEDHPVLGVGANNYTEMMDSYSESRSEWIYTVHNTYLLICSETGIVGIAVFVWFLVATIRQGWHCWKIRDPLLSPIAAGCVAAIVGFMEHMSVDCFRTGAAYDSMWLLAGLIGALYRLTLPLDRPSARIVYSRDAAVTELVTS